MRKFASIFIAMLLIAIPVIAFATYVTYTVRVQVSGGNLRQGNTVTYVDNDAVPAPVTRTFTGGTNYIYPTQEATLTVKVASGYKAEVTNGGTTTEVLPTATPRDFTVNQASTFKVVYVAPAPGGLSITRQNPGGVVLVELPNATTNATGATQVEAGTVLPIIIQANTGYVIDTIDVSGAGFPDPLPTYVDRSKLSFDYTVITNEKGTIEVTFKRTTEDLSQALSANLFAPLAGYANNEINCTAAVANNVTNPTYSFTLNSGTPTPYSSSPIFSFIPTAPGNYTVKVDVSGTINGRNATDSKTVTITVASKSGYEVSQCTSCHSSSFPSIVANYNNSVHRTSNNTKSTCQACHTADTPHSAGINHTTVSAATFQVISSSSAADPVRGEVGANFCDKCHADGGVAPLRHTIVADSALPINSTNCSQCHLSVHNPNPQLGGAIQKALNFGSKQDTTVSTLASMTGNGFTFITTDGVNIYVADAEANTIQKVAIATGSKSVIAGTGAVGSQDGPGLEATFNTPHGITTDGTNLYVADYNNNAIRKIAIATGEVTTMTTDQTITQPKGITTDMVNLFVSSGDLILKITPTGVVTTLGTGSNPYGLTTDGTNLYFANYGDHTIWRIPLGEGSAACFAGTSSQPGSADGAGLTAARFNGPVGITTDGTNLYVTDEAVTGNTIRKVNIATQEVATIAGTGTAGNSDGPGDIATFNQPYGATTDGINLYVTDYNNKDIRKLTP